MPFIEVTDSGANAEIRSRSTQTMTKALCDAFKIAPEIVTCYYKSCDNYSYGHAGKFGDNAEKFRIFVKVFAFPRAAEQKNQAALEITKAVTDAYSAAAKDVIIYFLDQQPADAFHAGLPSD